MTFIHRVRRAAVAMLTGAIVVFAVLSAPIVVAALTPAAAQISEDAQIALEQYGSWAPASTLRQRLGAPRRATGVASI